MHPTRAAANKGNLVKGLEFVAHILNGPPERAIVLLPTLPAFIDVIAVGYGEDSECFPLPQRLWKRWVRIYRPIRSPGLLHLSKVLNALRI